MILVNFCIRHCGIVAVLLIVFGLLWACQSDENATHTTDLSEKTDSTKTSADSSSQSPVAVSLTQAQYDVAGIELGAPTDRTLSTTLKVNGTIDVPAQNRVSVSVPFGGYIRQINLEPGMKVRQGQSLVVLENPDYIQLQQDYLDTKAKLEYADLEFARQLELSRDNVSALKVFQQTRSSRQSLQAQLAGLAQRLAMLRINPTTLSPERLTRTVVIPSPVAGFITSVPVNKGRFANPSDVVAEIVSLDHLHVQLRVFEKDISRVQVGQKLRFGMGGDASLIHPATIFLIGKSITEDRTINVLAHPETYSTDLIPGGYVAAQIQVKTEPMASLPESAIVSYGGKALIYVLEKKQSSPATYQFRQIELKTGIRENGYLAVTLPPTINPAKTPVVVKGAYSLLAKLNNSEEE
ncbi:efflux RND transporter periplasmic adaptor subunit [Spirosoma daeguense]